MTPGPGRLYSETHLNKIDDQPWYLQTCRAVYESTARRAMPLNARVMWRVVTTRGIKLMSNTMNIWKRGVEAQLRDKGMICEQQNGFMLRK